MSNAQKVDDGVGLSDSLRPEHQSARGPSALSLSGFGCLPVVADPSKRRCLGECWVRRLRTRGPHRRALARERKGGKRPRQLSSACARAVISAVRTRPLLVVVDAPVVNGAVETAGPHRPTSGPTRISGLGKYGKRFPACRRSRRRPRDSDRWHFRASVRAAGDGRRPWGSLRCLGQRRGSAESRGITEADARRLRLTVGRHGRNVAPKRLHLAILGIEVCNASSETSARRGGAGR
jgi:hypothetical protein